TSDVGVRELDLDGHSAAATLEGLHMHLVWLLRQGLRHVFDQRPVVDARAGRALSPVSAAVVAPAAAVTPRRSTCASLQIAQGSPPASKDFAQPRWAGRPAGASARPCRHRSSPSPAPS